MFKILKSSLLLMVFAAMALAACQPAGSGAAPEAAPPAEGYYGYDTAEKAVVADVTVAQEAGAGYFADGRTSNPAAPGTANTLERLVIKNASLSLVVKDPAQSVTDISRLADELGGFVVSSNTYQASVDDLGNKIMQGYITLRVPVDKLSQALTQLKGLAVTVNSENVSGEDVTAQYTDLASQLTNLQAAEAQLQKIMESATKTEDVLNVYNQLVSVRGQIETVKGQMKYYSESAAMSLISIDLIPDALSQPLQVAGWQPEGVAKEAFEALVRALQNIATSVIWGGVYLLPLLLLFGLPLYLIVRLALRRMRKPAVAEGK